MSTKRAPTHRNGRRIGLNSKHKGTGFKGKGPEENTLANPHKNSLAARIHRGDEKLLRDLGMTQQEASERLRNSFREIRLDQENMESWYRNAVRVRK